MFVYIFLSLLCHHIWNPLVRYLCSHADCRGWPCLAIEFGYIKKHHCFYQFKLSR